MKDLVVLISSSDSLTDELALEEVQRLFPHCTIFVVFPPRVEEGRTFADQLDGLVRLGIQTWVVPTTFDTERLRKNLMEKLNMLIPVRHADTLILEERELKAYGYREPVSSSTTA